MTESLSPLDYYHHRILIAADRVVQAFRSEDPTIISTEIAAAVAISVPEAGRARGSRSSVTRGRALSPST